MRSRGVLRNYPHFSHSRKCVRNLYFDTSDSRNKGKDRCLGYLARKMKLGTQFGAFLDPVADKDHPWFKGIEWDKLYQNEAAFIPEVNDELDTQNFEKFEESDNQNPSTTKVGP